MEIKEYLRIIKQRLWIVAIMILISTIMSAVANYYIIKPTYQANALLYVGKKVNEQESIAYYDLLLSDQLVRDYRVHRSTGRESKCEFEGRYSINTD